VKALGGLAAEILGAARTELSLDATGPAKPPEELRGIQLELWYVDQEIAETRAEIHRLRQNARLGGSVHGMAALQDQLRRLREERRMLQPPPPPSLDEEERQWRAQAQAVLAKIERGIKAAEEQDHGQGR
jgi:hypothetical protein